VDKRTRVFLVLFLFFLSIYAAIAYYATTNKPNEQFMGFGIYSGQDTLSGYTGPGSTVNINQTYHWTFNTTNEMGTTQLVQIITRLGNNQTIGPSATSPALLQVFANASLFVPNKSSALQNFDWNVTKVVTSAGVDYITVDINGRTTTSTFGNTPGWPFRFYFELWTFNSSTASFQYYTWLQIGFNVNSSS
jgi:hypothetical protein